MELVNFEVLSVCIFFEKCTFTWETYVQTCLQHIKQSYRITNHHGALDSESLHCSKDARGVALIPVESPWIKSMAAKQRAENLEKKNYITYHNVILGWFPWWIMVIKSIKTWSSSYSGLYGPFKSFQTNSKRQGVNRWKGHSFHHRNPSCLLWFCYSILHFDSCSQYKKGGLPSTLFGMMRLESLQWSMLGFNVERTNSLANGCTQYIKSWQAICSPTPTWNIHAMKDTYGVGPYLVISRVITVITPINGLITG